jgi:pimeloyl-ACP methyl ester carboxylesterase
MPEICINGLDHFYEQTGEGPALVFLHGAFADARLWNPQWDYFSAKCRILRYDLRGHGRTGASNLGQYSIETFADDLDCLLDALQIRMPVICGLSWGGSIALAFAARNPSRLKALILAGASVSISLTFLDKILCYVLFPRWVMALTIKSMSVERFTHFSFWLARFTRGKDWLSSDIAIREYLQQCMLQMDRAEYLKIWKTIYSFRLQSLERITCPTLVLNGEYEPKGTFSHTAEILRRVPQAEAKVIPATSHAMNLENPGAFNKFIEEYLI